MRTRGAERLRGWGAAALALMLIGGCASHSPPVADEAKVRQFAGQGYFADDRYDVATTFHTWSVDNAELNHALTLPGKEGRFPLVIYLPGLGETPAAGDAWRTAWAQAGYAVVSVQPLADDAVTWSSARARAGDFAEIARDRYAGKAMRARMEVLRKVLAELLRRHDAGIAPFDRVDPSHMAIAGYDLGAYAAMFAAGEHVRDAVLPDLPIAPGAVIALSPYADFAGIPFAERYGEIRGAVLSVTGDNDVDPLGLVTSPSVRKAPFQYMPGGRKYLLVLAGATHRTLAGNKNGPAAEESRPSEAAGNQPPEGGRGGRHRKGGAASGGDGSRGRERPAQGGQASPTAQAIDVAAVQAMTTAFLDACVKNDPIAQEWLAKNAARWIKDRGEFEAK